MNDEELTAYWAAFQRIMRDAADKMPDTIPQSPGNDSGSDANDDVTPGHDSNQEDGNKCLVKPAEVKPLMRIRGKTASQKVEAISLAKIQSFRKKAPSKEEKKEARRSTKSRLGPSGSPPKKRKYEQGEGVERKGKKSCVSIWMTVQLFKVSWRRLLYSVLYCHALCLADCFSFIAV